MLAQKIEEPEIILCEDIFNRSFRPYLDSWVRNEVFYGGGGSGKSMFITQRSVIRLMEIPGYNLLVIRQVSDSNRTTTFAGFQQVISEWGVEDFFRTNKSDMTITCLRTKNQVVFKGLDNIAKIKSFTFPTGPLTAIWVEEANEVSQDDFIQLDSVRLRGIARITKQMTVSFNPVDEDSWLKGYFFDSPKNKTYFAKHGEFDPEALKHCRTLVHFSTYIDNEFYGQDDLEKLLNLENIDELIFKVYVLGEWGSYSKARIFSNFIIEDFDIKLEGRDIQQGCDFGWNDPNAFTRSYVRDKDLWIFGEHYKSLETPEELIRAIKEFKDVKDDDGDVIIPNATRIPIICDSSEPATIKIMKRAGLKAKPSKKGPDSVIFGIRWLQQYPKIHIHKTNCPNTGREFKMYKWKEDKDGILHDQPLDMDNHSIDSLRYGQEPIALSKRQSISLPGGKRLI